MKMTLFVFCLLLTSAAFGQYYGGSSVNSQPMVYQPPNHPAHASYAPLASETSVVGGSTYTIAQGERAFSDLPQPPQVSLGDAARELKKEHEHVKKARVVWTNQ